MIKLQGITKRFATTQVLRGVSFDVREGEVSVIVGPSGGGKSTLLRCINGLEPFDEGRVEVDGHCLRGGPPCRRSASRLTALRQRVGMVFQQFNLFPHLSVMENVMSGPLHALGLPRSVAAERASRLLHRVGLAEKKDHKPGTLSGGQQQRVAIARALANEPAVILFDEPTSALDPRMTAEVLAVMADLASTGQTMIVVSHAMDFVRKSANRVHVLADGEVVESGPPDQLLENPQHPATRDFLVHALS